MIKDTLDRSVAPGIFPMGRLCMPSVSTVKLDNGVSLNVLDRGEDEVNRLTVVIDGGLAESPVAGLPDLAALARLDGTTRFSGDEIAETLDFNGSWARCAASVHHQSLTFHSLNSRMDRVMPVMLQLASQPVFPCHATEVAREKAARRLENDMQKVTWHAARALDSIVMGKDCAVAREVTPDSLRAMTPDMLREWHSATFSPERVNLYLAGRITPRIEDMVARAFGELSPGGDCVARVSLEFHPDMDCRTVKVDRPGSLQTAVKCAIPAIGRSHPDYVSLRLAVMALGGYFGSRLMLNIREDKGYTYGISAALVGYTEGSFITIDTECDNGYTQAVLDEIHAEIRRMHDPSTYTEMELERLRSYLTTSLAAQLDSPFAAMDYYVVCRTADTQPGYFDAQQDALAAMTPELLADIARRYIDPDNLFTALAGA